VLAVPYVPGLNSSAYRCVPISSSTCSAATASTVAWIWLSGMLGSKTFTFGPKPGAGAAAVTRAGSDPALSPA
jgi:hypothetical protein